MNVSNESKTPLKDMSGDEIKALHNTDVSKIEYYWSGTDIWCNYDYNHHRSDDLFRSFIYRTKPLSQSEQLESEKKRVTRWIRTHRDLSPADFESVAMLINSISIGETE